MDIVVVSSKGTAKTELSSFDSALKNAGVHNFNLIPLSSVIPPKANIVQKEKITERLGEVGDRLYLVKAEMRGTNSSEYIGAAIGWYVFGDEGGVFVEHETRGFTEEVVRKELEQRVERSLQDLCIFREKSFDNAKIGSVYSITKVEDDPACVLALAVYKAEPW